MNKNLEKVFYGKEPIRESYDKSNILEAYNFYNYMSDKDQSKNWLMQYLYTENRISSSHSLKENFPLNLGWIARILSFNATIPEENLKYFENTWPQYVAKPNKKVETNEKPTLYSKSCLIADVEDIFDDFYLSEYEKKEFDFLSFLKLKSATQLAIQEIKSYYIPLQEEIQDKEGSSHLTKKQKSNYLEFLDNLIKSCDFYLNNKQQNRKPRKVREKPIDKLIKKLSYKIDDKELNIVSINPIKIINSKAVLLYNTKTKVMTYLSGNKLTVSGSTIKDFNEKESYAKTIRSQYVEQNSTIKSILKTLKDKKGTEKPISGRVNVDTLILKVS